MAYIEIEGYAELDRALRELSVVVERDFIDDLKYASEPVRIRSEQLALSEISGMKRKKTVDWTQMRLGKTANTIYEAPAKRRTVGKPRPNLAKLLMMKSMRPGAEEKLPEVALEVDQIIDRALTRVGF